MVTSMPSRQRNWHLCTCWRPSIATRHSKQTPMPQRGPRSSPDTERRKAELPANKTAAATVEPRGMRTATPLMVICTRSGMGSFHDAAGKIGLERNGRSAVQHLIEQQAGSSQRSCDAQTLVPGGEVQMLVAGTLADNGQLVRSGGAKTCPAADGRHARELRQVLAGPGEHAGDD